MNSAIKRFTAACVSALMALALFPTTPVRAEEDIPVWAQDPNYQEEEPLTAQEELPSSFDLRDRGVVTPVKLQDPHATCWAFAGIAAAETSIISDLGAPADLDLSEKHLAWFAMHPVQEVDDPSQAGEGITVFNESEGGSSAAYAGVSSIVVSTLFSAGIGPVYENDTDGLVGFPYRGKEGLTVLDVFSNNEYKGRWMEDMRRRFIQAYGSEKDALEEILKTTDFKSLDEYLEQDWEQKRRNVKTNYYSDLDDWSIPTTNEEGVSNRNVFVGYTLRDGNILPELTNIVDSHYVGYSEEGMRATKQELMAGHGVAIGYRADVALPGLEEWGGYLNKKTWAHYTLGLERDNHSVCIVGWDDNYPASNFTHPQVDMDDDEAAKVTTPPGDGAWIVKNSWGCADGTGTAVNDGSQVLGKTDWGVDGSGYFYISYYDNSLSMPESFKFDNDLDGDEFYSHVYDYMPATDRFYELSDSKAMSSANVFTAEADEQVVSVSTRTMKSNSRVTFALYHLHDDAKSPVDGELVETQSYNIPYAGFHRLDLTNPFKVKAGQKFSVVSTVSQVAEDGTPTYEVAASRAENEESAKERGAGFFCTAVVHKGESYLYRNGEWHDWVDHLQNAIKAEDGEVVDNFSIKAFALPWDGTDYECVGGDKATWTQGGSVGLSFTYEEANEHGRPVFDHATVDGEEIDLASCVVNDTNMVIALSAEYLSGLSVGEHAIVAYFGDGDPVTATFTIVAAEQSSGDGQGQVTPSDAGKDADVKPGGAGNNAGGKSNTGARQSSASGKGTAGSGLPRTGDETSPLSVAFALGIACTLLVAVLRLRGQRREDS